MSSGADLFVVCKQCGSEVSPYVTECPYCGNRLRRRAPKLPTVGESGAESTRRQGGLARLLPGRSGAARRPAAARARVQSSRYAATRPNATIALVTVSCVMYVLPHAVHRLWIETPILGPLEGHWWRLLTFQFLYFPGSHNGVFALAAVGAVALFGWLLEQRHGPAAVIGLFFLAGITGGLVIEAVYAEPIGAGANAAALALLAAWAVPDLLAARSGSYYEGDLLGAGAWALLLVALPFGTEATSWLAGVVGLLLGLLFGYSVVALRHGAGDER